MTDSIKLGDIVKLKSGGPAMTVDSGVHGAVGTIAGRLRCAWFVNYERREGEFDQSALKLVDDHREGPSLTII